MGHIEQKIKIYIRIRNSFLIDTMNQKKRGGKNNNYDNPAISAI